MSQRWLCSWKPGNEADMWHQPVIFAFPAIITMWAIVLSSLIGSSLPALLMLSLTLWCNYCKYPPDNSQLSPSQSASASNYHHHHPGSSLCCYKGIQVDLWFASSWVQHSYVLKATVLKVQIRNAILGSHDCIWEHFLFLIIINCLVIVTERLTECDNCLVTILPQALLWSL